MLSKASYFFENTTCFNISFEMLKILLLVEANEIQLEGAVIASHLNHKN